MLTDPFELHKPKDIAELNRSVQQLTNWRLLAGGTFLINNLKAAKRRGRKSPDHIISLKHIPDLCGVATKNDVLTIGSMTTLTGIAEDNGIAAAFPVLKKACLGIGTTQIRNMATIGGNLTCRYTWTELPAVMIALEATLTFLEADKENELSAEQFFANEAKSKGVLTAISIPLKNERRVSYQRAVRTPGIDTPMLAVTAALETDGERISSSRIVINTGVTFPKRDKAVEEFLNGKPIDKELGEMAQEHMTGPIYETDDDYKKHMYSVSIRNAINDAIKGQC
jgi:CO/xanthine dehydrogenase FAD-binding subunit